MFHARSGMRKAPQLQGIGKLHEKREPQLLKIWVYILTKSITKGGRNE